MTEQMEITLETLKARVEASSVYAMDMSFSRDFAAFTGRPETEVLGVVRELMKRELSNFQGRKKYEEATRKACEGVLYWFEHAGEFVVSDLVSFVASHDPACVYAVLLGQKARLLSVEVEPSVSFVSEVAR